MQKLKVENFSHLNESVIKRLAQNRITTILEFLEEDVTKLTILTNLSLPQVLSIRNQIFSKYSASLISGTTIHKNILNKKLRLPSGLERLDAIIDGGIPTNFITEVCGLADSGKTQFSLQLAINNVKDSKNAVLYVDTKGDFSAIRVQKILEANDLSHKKMAEIMYQIRIVHIWMMEELIDLLKKIKDGTIVIENLSLIIIDSLPCLMFQYLGDENKVGLSFLNTLVNYSRYLGTELNIAIVYINIQTRWVENDISDLEDDGEIAPATKEYLFVEKRYRCLGRYWERIPALVLQLEKVHESSIESDCMQLKVLVLKHRNVALENSQCSLNLTAMGIT